jgi:hypothetical protein
MSTTAHVAILFRLQAWRDFTWALFLSLVWLCPSHYTRKEVPERTQITNSNQIKKKKSLDKKEYIISIFYETTAYSWSRHQKYLDKLEAIF